MIQPFLAEVLLDNATPSLLRPNASASRGRSRRRLLKTISQLSTSSMLLARLPAGTTRFAAFPAAMETSAVSSSNRQSNVAFKHRCLHLRALSALPQCRGVQYPIPDGPPVRTFAARNGARDADKLGAHLIGRQLNLRITVSSKIDELEVQSQVRVGQQPCALEVEAPCIFEARPDAVSQQHVEGPVRFRHSLPVGKKQCPQRMVLLEIVLVGLHGAGTDE